MICTCDRHKNESCRVSLHITCSFSVLRHLSKCFLLSEQSFQIPSTVVPPLQHDINFRGSVMRLKQCLFKSLGLLESVRYDKVSELNVRSLCPQF